MPISFWLIILSSCVFSYNTSTVNNSSVDNSPPNNPISCIPQTRAIYIVTRLALTGFSLALRSGFRYALSFSEATARRFAFPVTGWPLGPLRPLVNVRRRDSDAGVMGANYVMHAITFASRGNWSERRITWG